MKMILLVLVVLVLASCKPPEQQVTKTNSSGSASQAPSRWPSSNFPLNLKISDAFSSQESTAIQAIGSQWESGLGNQLNFFSHTGTSINKVYSDLDQYQDGEFGVYRLTTWPAELPFNALAVTQIFGLRKNIGTSSELVEITHADVLINEQFYDFTHDHQVGYDLKTVVLHEMGHFIGLYHNTVDSSTVMAPYISSTSEKRSPYTADLNNLSKLYGLSVSGTALTASDVPGRAAMASKKEIGPSLPVRILIELRADGTCLHRENGMEIKRH